MKLGLRKVIISIIAIVFTLGCGITLAATLYNAYKKDSPDAAGPGIARPTKLYIPATMSQDDIDQSIQWSQSYQLWRYYNEYDTMYISSRESLITFREMVNGYQNFRYSGCTNDHLYMDFADKNIVLDANINLAAQDWVPIGRADYPLEIASFDGQGYTISNIDINVKKIHDKYGDDFFKFSRMTNSDTFGVGFFGVIDRKSADNQFSTIEIKNLRLSDVYIHSDDFGDAGSVAMSWADTGVGCLAGYVLSNINVTNCSVDGEILGQWGNICTDISVAAYAGLVGVISISENFQYENNRCLSTFTNCVANVPITDKYSYGAILYGGANGFQFAGITNIYEGSNTGDKTVKLEIKNCVYCGDIITTQEIDDGLNGRSIAGDMYSWRSIQAYSNIETYATVSNCYFIGECNDELAPADRVWQYLKVPDPKNHRTTIEEYQNKTLGDKGDWFAFGYVDGFHASLTTDLYQNVVSSFDLENRKMYVPTTNEYYDGIPLPLCFAVRDAMPEMQIEIIGSGSVSFSPSSVTTKTSITSTGQLNLCIPYEPFDGNDYASNYLAHKSWGKSGDSFNIYGYTLTITPNSDEGWEIFSVTLYEGSDKVTSGHRYKATSTNPYSLEVRFERDELNVSVADIYFGGFLVDGKAVVAQHNDYQLYSTLDFSTNGKWYCMFSNTLLYPEQVKMDSDGVLWVKANHSEQISSSSTGKDWTPHRLFYSNYLKNAIDYGFSIKEETDGQYPRKSYPNQGALWSENEYKDGNYVYYQREGTTVDVKGKKVSIYIWGLLKTKTFTVSTKSSTREEDIEVSRAAGLIYKNSSDIDPQKTIDFTLLDYGYNGLTNSAGRFLSQGVNYQTSILYSVYGNYLNFVQAPTGFVQVPAPTLQGEYIFNIYDFSDYFITNANVLDISGSVNSSLPYIEIDKGFEKADDKFFVLEQNSTTNYNLMFDAIQYSIFAYYDAGSEFVASEPIVYTVEKGVAFGLKDASASFPFKDPTTKEIVQEWSDFWGLCLDASVWTQYGYTLSGPSDVVNSTYDYCYYTLTKTRSTDSIRFAVEKDAIKTKLINGKNYDYVQICDIKTKRAHVSSDYLIRGLVQESRPVRSLSGALTLSSFSSTGDIPNMTYAGATVPCILRFSEEDEYYKIRFNDITYKFNGQTFNALSRYGQTYDDDIISGYLNVANLPVEYIIKGMPITVTNNNSEVMTEYVAADGKTYGMVPYVVDPTNSNGNNPVLLTFSPNKRYVFNLAYDIVVQLSGYVTQEYKYNSISGEYSISPGLIADDEGVITVDVIVTLRTIYLRAMGFDKESTSSGSSISIVQSGQILAASFWNVDKVQTETTYGINIGISVSPSLKRIMESAGIDFSSMETSVTIYSNICDLDGENQGICIAPLAGYKLKGFSKDSFDDYVPLDHLFWRFFPGNSDYNRLTQAPGSSTPFLDIDGDYSQFVSSSGSFNAPILLNWLCEMEPETYTFNTFVEQEDGFVPTQRTYNVRQAVRFNFPVGDNSNVYWGIVWDEDLWQQLGYRLVVSENGTYLAKINNDCNCSYCSDGDGVCTCQGKINIFVNTNNGQQTKTINGKDYTYYLIAYILVGSYGSIDDQIGITGVPTFLPFPRNDTAEIKIKNNTYSYAGLNAQEAVGTKQLEFYQGAQENLNIIGYVGADGYAYKTTLADNNLTLVSNAEEGIYLTFNEITIDLAIRTVKVYFYVSDLLGGAIFTSPYYTNQSILKLYNVEWVDANGDIVSEGVHTISELGGEIGLRLVLKTINVSLTTFNALSSVDFESNYGGIIFDEKGKEISSNLTILAASWFSFDTNTNCIKVKIFSKLTDLFKGENALKILNAKNYDIYILPCQCNVSAVSVDETHTTMFVAPKGGYSLSDSNTVNYCYSVVSSVLDLHAFPTNNNSEAVTNKFNTSNESVPLTFAVGVKLETYNFYMYNYGADETSFAATQQSYTAEQEYVFDDTEIEVDGEMTPAHWGILYDVDIWAKYGYKLTIDKVGLVGTLESIEECNCAFCADNLGVCPCKKRIEFALGTRENILALNDGYSYIEIEYFNAGSFGSIENLIETAGGIPTFLPFSSVDVYRNFTITLLEYTYDEEEFYTQTIDDSDATANLRYELDFEDIDDLQVYFGSNYTKQAVEGGRLVVSQDKSYIELQLSINGKLHKAKIYFYALDYLETTGKLSSKTDMDKILQLYDVSWVDKDGNSLSTSLIRGDIDAHVRLKLKDLEIRATTYLNSADPYTEDVGGSVTYSDGNTQRAIVGSSYSIEKANAKGYLYKLEIRKPARLNSITNESDLSLGDSLNRLNYDIFVFEQGYKLAEMDIASIGLVSYVFVYPLGGYSLLPDNLGNYYYNDITSSDALIPMALGENQFNQTANKFTFAIPLKIETYYFTVYTYSDAAENSFEALKTYEYDITKLFEFSSIEHSINTPLGQTDKIFWGMIYNANVWHKYGYEYDEINKQLVYYGDGVTDKTRAKIILQLGDNTATLNINGTEYTFIEILSFKEGSYGSIEDLITAQECDEPWILPFERSDLENTIELRVKNVEYSLDDESGYYVENNQYRKYSQEGEEELDYDGTGYAYTAKILPQELTVEESYVRFVEQKTKSQYVTIYFYAVDPTNGELLCSYNLIDLNKIKKYYKIEWVDGTGAPLTDGNYREFDNYIVGVKLTLKTANINIMSYKANEQYQETYNIKVYNKDFVEASSTLQTLASATFSGNAINENTYKITINIPSVIRTIFAGRAEMLNNLDYEIYISSNVCTLDEISAGINCKVLYVVAESGYTLTTMDVVAKYHFGEINRAEDLTSISSSKVAVIKDNDDTLVFDIALNVETYSFYTYNAADETFKATERQYTTETGFDFNSITHLQSFDGKTYQTNWAILVDALKGETIWRQLGYKLDIVENRGTLTAIEECDCPFCEELEGVCPCKKTISFMLENETFTLVVDGVEYGFRKIVLFETGSFGSIEDEINNLKVPVLFEFLPTINFSLQINNLQYKFLDEIGYDTVNNNYSLENETETGLTYNSIGYVFKTEMVEGTSITLNPDLSYVEFTDIYNTASRINKLYFYAYNPINGANIYSKTDIRDILKYYDIVWLNGLGEELVAGRAYEINQSYTIFVQLRLKEIDFNLTSYDATQTVYRENDGGNIVTISGERPQVLKVLLGSSVKLENSTSNYIYKITISIPELVAPIFKNSRLITAMNYEIYIFKDYYSYNEFKQSSDATQLFVYPADGYALNDGNIVEHYINSIERQNLELNKTYTINDDVDRVHIYTIVVAMKLQKYTLDLYDYDAENDNSFVKYGQVVNYDCLTEKDFSTIKHMFNNGEEQIEGVWAINENQSIYSAYNYQLEIKNDIATLTYIDPLNKQDMEHKAKIQFALGSKTFTWIIGEVSYKFREVLNLKLGSFGSVEYGPAIPWILPFPENADGQESAQLKLMNVQYYYNDSIGYDTALDNKQYNFVYSNKSEDKTYQSGGYVYITNLFVGSAINFSRNFVEIKSSTINFVAYFYARNPITEELMSSAEDMQTILSFYNVSWVYLYEDNFVQVVLDDSVTIETNSPIEIAVRLTLKTVALEVTPLNVTEMQFGVGAEVSKNQYNLEHISACNAAVGSSISVENEADYYIVRVGLSTPLASIFINTKALKALNYSIYVIPKHSINLNLQPENAQQIFVITRGGYQLTTNPIGFYQNDLAAVREEGDLLTDLTSIQPNDSLKKLIVIAKYKKLDYNLPLYYDLPNGETEYKTKNVKFNSSSSINISKTTLLEEDVAYNEFLMGWILSANPQALLEQGFSHIYYNAEMLSLNSMQEKDVAKIFDSGKVCLVRDTTNHSNPNFANSIIDYDCWNFVFDNSYETLNGKYYVVSTLEQNSYGDLEQIKFTNETKGPYIRAIWSKTYELTIENALYTNAKLNSIHGKDMETIQNYFGVNASGSGIKVNNTELVTDLFGNQSYMLTLELKDNSSYNYPFFTNHLTRNYNTSFYTQNDFITFKEQTTSTNGQNYWYVYNYGYEVSSWAIMFTIGEEENLSKYDVYLSEGKWTYSLHSTTKPVSVADLNTSNLSKIAGVLNGVSEYTISSSETAKIYLVPIWTPVKIIPTINNKDNLTSSNYITYGTAYKFDRYNTSNTPDGQSLIYFRAGLSTEADATNVIINPETNNVIWNYQNIEYTNFTYYNTYYTLNLTPVFANNIYKVELEDMKLNGESYDLSSISNFKFSESATYKNKVYTYKQINETVGGILVKFTTYSDFYSSNKKDNWLWSESYAKNLSTFLQNYDLATQGRLGGVGNYLNILNKIYCEGNTTSITADSVVGNNVKFYIYLVNNQDLATIPAFETSFYKQILWYNSGSNQYGTNITFAYRTDLFNAELHNVAVYENNFEILTQWKYSQNYISGQGYPEIPSLKAFYFRDYYYIEPQTLLKENAKLGEYGYALISMEDEIANEADAKYLVVYLSGAMRYYLLDSSIKNWSSIGDYVNENCQFSGVLDLIDQSKLFLANSIVLYAGCNLSITMFDQSQDAQAMLSSKFDEMIGYMWDSIVWENVSLNETHENLGGYVVTMDYESIYSNNLQVAKTYVVKINFDKIPYTFGVKVDAEAGSFRITKNNKTIESNKSQVNSVPIKVGESVTITYNAVVGYEFESNAFVLVLPDGTEILLVAYETLKQNGTIIQKYVLELSGSWLRQNFYLPKDDEDNLLTDSYTSFALDQTHFGEIQINTCQMTFKQYTMLYDSNKNGEDAILQQVLENESWQCVDDAEIKNVSLTEAFKLFTLNSELGGWVYNHSVEDNIIAYVPIQSYAYINGYLNNKSKTLAQYNFPMQNIPTEMYHIDRYQYLNEMLGVGAGTIVPESQRQIFMIIEVKELLKLDVFIIPVEHDPAGVARQATITTFESQTQPYSVTLTAQNESPLIDETWGVSYYVADTIFTYKGQTNKITTNIAITEMEKRYSNVVFALNGKEQSNQFSITADSYLTIQFIPKPLTINYNYYLNNQKVNSIQQLYLETTADEQLYIDSAPIQFVVKITDVDYYLQNVVINGASKTPNNVNTISYSITQNDFTVGSINVNIYVSIKPGEAVTIIMRLLDNSQSTSYDSLANNFIAYVDGNAQDSQTFTVREGKELYVEFNLGVGYIYTGTYDVNNNRINRSSEGNKLTLVQSFNASADGGLYVIYVQKVLFNVNLIIDSNVKGDYTLSSNINNTLPVTSYQGSAKVLTLPNRYIGDIINFELKRKSSEQELNYYYYELNNGSTVERKIIDGNNVQLTNEILKALNGSELNFRIAVREKYQINLIVSGTNGAERLLTYSATLDGKDDFVSGNYYLEGTNVSFSFKTQLMDKYIITISANGVNVGEKSDNEIVYNFLLSQNTTIQATIQPAKFGLSYNEYHQDNLPDLTNDNLPAINSGFINEDVNEFNNPNSTVNSFDGLLYDNSMQINLVLQTDNYSLTHINLTTIEGYVLSVNISNGELAVTLNGQILKPDGNGFYNFVVNKQVYRYRLEIFNNTLRITYTTKQNTELEAFYTNIKEIKPTI